MNTVVTTPAPFRDPKSGAGAIREAIKALADVDATMDKNTKAIAAADPDLGKAIQTFRLDYEEYLRNVVVYAQRTRNVSNANLRILAADGPRGLILIAKQKIGDSNPLAEKAKELQARANALRERVLATELANTSWGHWLAGGFFVLACCVAAVITLPFALPVEIAIGASVGIAILGTATLTYVRYRMNEIEASGDAVRITAKKLEKIEGQMKKILMAVAEGRGKAESLESLREIFEEEPDLCEVLVTQVKDMYKDIVKDCDKLEEIANENYFKNIK